jgi:hypothetical protein
MQTNKKHTTNTNRRHGAIEAIEGKLFESRAQATYIYVGLVRNVSIEYSHKLDRQNHRFLRENFNGVHGREIILKILLNIVSCRENTKVAQSTDSPLNSSIENECTSSLASSFVRAFSSDVYQQACFSSGVMSFADMVVAIPTPAGLNRTLRRLPLLIIDTVPFVRFITSLVDV